MSESHIQQQTLLEGVPGFSAVTLAELLIRDGGLVDDVTRTAVILKSHVGGQIILLVRVAQAQIHRRELGRCVCRGDWSVGRGCPSSKCRALVK
jgi:hypothetical protein